MLNLDVEEGGMKTMNSENQQKNVPGKIEIISQFGHKQQKIFSPIVSIHNTLNATVDPKHIHAVNKIDSHFWREAIKARTLMNKNREPSIDSIRTELIWNSKNIKFKGHPLLYSN